MGAVVLLHNTTHVNGILVVLSFVKSMVPQLSMAFSQVVTNVASLISRPIHPFSPVLVMLMPKLGLEESSMSLINNHQPKHQQLLKHHQNVVLKLKYQLIG